MHPNIKEMIRTFHSKISKVALFFCLLPSTVLAVYFFWVKIPLAALVFMLFMVAIVERMIHTSFTLTDDGKLILSKGRFSSKIILLLQDIEKVEVHKPSSINLLYKDEVVVLSCKNGKQIYITPVPVREFCRFLLKKKDELC